MYLANTHAAYKKAKATHRAAQMMAKNGLVLTQTQKDVVVSEVKRYVDLANAHYGKPMPMPQVLFNKSGSGAGNASHAYNQVNFNPALLVREWGDMVAETIPHEVAHIVSRHLHYPRRIRSHGDEWQSVMHTFGIPNPRRTHSYDTTGIKRQVPRYEYVCGCPTAHHLVAKQHHRILRGGWYRCKRCRQVLVSRTNVTPNMLPPSRPSVEASPHHNPGTPSTPAAPKSMFGSKLDKCRTLFKFNGRKPRQQVIALFVNEADCTPAGAATYYATLKKEFGL